MKFFVAIASLVAAAAAQRLSIVSPAPESTLTTGKTFVTELHQDQSATSLEQVSVTISLSQCYSNCYDPAQRGPATVIYNGAYNPQYNSSASQKGLYEDFYFDLPSGWPTGAGVLEVAHLFRVGAAAELVFDYSEVHVNIAN